MATLFKKKFMRVPNLHFGSAFKEIGRNAYVDWIVVLVTSLVVAIALVGGGLYLYWQISSGNFKGSGAATSTPKQIFDEQALNSVTDLIKTKEDTLIQLRKSYNGPQDPSQ